ncbi:hypothetical protein HU200_008671 [Digitaria exilis]|uniref:Uncharacterized protein n=1 Tax=Digitaria exilis TaxID=1010633 RepID=A0A835KQ27_9POAL|nr:hypothetical protein HU200_008671 [Digitaria exilis]
MAKYVWSMVAVVMGAP